MTLGFLIFDFQTFHPRTTSPALRRLICPRCCGGFGFLKSGSDDSVGKVCHYWVRLSTFRLLAVDHHQAPGGKLIGYFLG